MNHSHAYLKFIAAASTLRPGNVDSLEERLLTLFAPFWLRGETLTVVQAMRLDQDISATTVHRRLKTMRKKGLIALTVSEEDGRIKHITPTPETTHHFERLGRLMAGALTRH